MKNIIDNLCWAFSGNQREFTLNLGETIDGIYIADNPYEEYSKDDLISKILDKDYGTGTYLCLKVKDKRLKCEELACETNMPTLGSLPVEFSFSALVNQIMGRGKVFTYPILLERNDTFVSIVYKE